MKILGGINCFVFSILFANTILAQDNPQPCKVASANLNGNYQGACKKGWANGEGEAIGLHHYKGAFKNGLPDGKGIYYFNDNLFYTGNFQNGIKEGKGELHYVNNAAPDSVIKGYWSGDEYRGERYSTYRFNTSETFDSYEIIPSDQMGNTLAIEISTTTGAPNGTAISLTAKSGFILSLNDIVATNDCIITKVVANTTTSKSLYKYILSKFPAHLLLTLSNGRTIELDLYKAAKWDVRLFLNR